MLRIWQIAIRYKECTPILADLLVIYKNKLYDSHKLRDFIDVLVKKYHISERHYIFLAYLVYSLLLRENEFPYVTKRNSFLVHSKPSIGKTSLITFIKEKYSDLAFYIVGNRANDFSNFPLNEKPLII